MPKNYGLILNPPEPDHWELGSGLASQRFGGEVNPEGDWNAYKAPDEDQRKLGLETMNCTNYATIKAWLMLSKLYGLKLPGMSERYTGVHTGTSRNGNNPHNVAEVIRKYCGMVPDAVMPWHEEVDTWEEYYDRRQAESLLPLGKKLLNEYDFGHEWVFAFGSSHTLKQRRELLRQALTRGPVCISVYAWRKKGKLYANPDKQHNHWVTVLRFDGDKLVIHDQYSPFVKTLTADHHISAAKVYFLKKREPGPRDFLSRVWENFRSLFSSL